MAVALSWQGYVDTDLDFAEFFAHAHTIVVAGMVADRVMVPRAHDHRRR